ncbi:hypothetical protein RJT34_15603 [Clitoria ternatea]|uniref:F-box domain-containing protein n=1 Tax=Clitoria ternatea TaxID=43366 RepID=A0AAN9J5R5_CLITE
MSVEIARRLGRKVGELLEVEDPVADGPHLSVAPTKSLAAIAAQGWLVTGRAREVGIEKMIGVDLETRDEGNQIADVQPVLEPNNLQQKSPLRDKTPETDLDIQIENEPVTLQNSQPFQKLPVRAVSLSIPSSSQQPTSEPIAFYLNPHHLTSHTNSTHQSNPVDPPNTIQNQLDIPCVKSSLLQQKLNQLINRRSCDNESTQISEIQDQINQIRKREEVYWSQRSRIQWLRWGDSNTRFFHASTIQRRARNRILRIQDNNNNWFEGHDEAFTFFSIMAGVTSWISHYDGGNQREAREFDSFSELDEEVGKEKTAVSVDMILPDELLEWILAYLPIASIFRAGCVCKRWYETVSSKRFLWNLSHSLPQKPWYYMFTSSDEPTGYAYDPVLRKWYGIELPFIETSNWFIASSYGLVCFMDNDNCSGLCMCNPITKRCKKLEEPPNLKFSDYSALALSVNREFHSYTVAIVKSKQIPQNFFQWDISIHIYDSKSETWMTIAEVLMGWRGGDESVVCNDVLYFLVYSTGGGPPESRHALIAYDISNRSSHATLRRRFIAAPCSLTCGRLMNMKEKLVMVGGIGKHDRPDIIKGIGIWVLNNEKWEEIVRMPHKYFQGFGEFDDVFASSGTDDIIYIQSYGSPALLTFDMNLRQWKWSQKCPVMKRFPLQLFTGFCFEPRLEIAP